jgi:hypothetical protein
VYYNTLVEWGERRIKYGVVSVGRLREDLEAWEHLYLAGRLQKPCAERCMLPPPPTFPPPRDRVRPPRAAALAGACMCRAC